MKIKTEKQFTLWLLSDERFIDGSLALANNLKHLLEE